MERCQKHLEKNYFQFTEIWQNSRDCKEIPAPGSPPNPNANIFFSSSLQLNFIIFWRGATRRSNFAFACSVHRPTPFPLGTAIHLWGRSGRGHCRKYSGNFFKVSVNFPQNFCRFLIFYFPRIFRRNSANFLQNPLANDPK